MKRKRGLIIGSIGLTIIIILFAITASSTFNWIEKEGINFEFFSINPISAKVTESISFEAQDIKNIEIISSEGDITIIPGNSDKILVDLEKTGWGGTQAKALEKAQSLELTSKAVNNTLYLTNNPPTTINFITYQGGSDKIDMTIQIPPNISLKTVLKDGDISIKDLENPIDLEGKFGDISLTNITGEIKALNQDGDIIVTDSQAFEKDVTIQTEFGDIEVIGMQSGTTYISTRDGDIKITDLGTSDNLELSSEFGGISLKDFNCRNLTISARDSRTNLQTGQVSDELFIDSQFGNIEIKNVEANSYTFEARDGDIDLDNINGLVTANVRFGDIDIRNGTNVTLSITTGDGSINFSGTLNPTSNQNIKTQFGDVILTIPDDSNFNLSVETRFGEFTSEIPVNITIGPDSPINKDKNLEKWEGQMNDGGVLISIATQDGDIQIKSNETIK
jgi:DUF4097 and DUF4098 domain-containing protein YvlB